ncbi:MAG: arginase, partial [Flavobacterium sp.]
GHNKLKRNTLLPCCYEDYIGACNNELPERWWKAQRKNII